jgi:TonB family protein
MAMKVRKPVIASGRAVLASATALLLLAACASRQPLDSNWIKRANEHLESTDGKPMHDDESNRRLSALWADKPERVALLSQTHARNMRVISGVVPICPGETLGVIFPVRVVVSFVVGTRGRVQDARILESYNPLFDSSALEAIGKFKFIPAHGRDGRAESQMTTFPIVFIKSQYKAG